MRKIKFRQWNKGSFHYWGTEADCFTGPLCNQIDIASEQFTGLKDKNGKEIYKGDILSYTGESVYLNGKKTGRLNTNTYEVTDDECDFLIKVLKSDLSLIGSISSLQYWPAEMAEIIGNIHENMELLK